MALGTPTDIQTETEVQPGSGTNIKRDEGKKKSRRKSYRIVTLGIPPALLCGTHTIPEREILQQLQLPVIDVIVQKMQMHPLPRYVTFDVHR